MEKKVLIIDSDKELCIAYTKVLETDGFEVTCEHDGVNGIMTAVEFKPDVIILDTKLPQTDGFEVIESILNQTTLGPKIIVSTDELSEDGEKKAYDVGATKCIKKSDLQAENLGQVVKDVLLAPKKEKKIQKKVLIVDDNEEICEMYKVILELEDYEVRVEYNGLKGLTTAIEYNPDIIILDIMMPQTNGFEVLESVKHHTSLDTIIIVNSNLNSAKDEEKALELGANRYLRKSDYTPDEVVAIIKSYEK